MWGSRKQTDDLAAARVSAFEDLDSLTAVLKALASATTAEQAIARALGSVRASFGWDYGSFWRIDPASGTLRFDQESGTAGAEFRAVTLEASFARGVGLSGRAWKTRDLVFVQDLGEVKDCVHAPAAQRAGVKSGVCFPIVVGNDVVGTMDFFSTSTLSPSPRRLEALRSIGRLVSQAAGRAAEAEQQAGTALDAAAFNGVMRAVAGVTDQDAAAQAALDAIRREFGWDYGSYWAVDEAAGALRFVLESGSAGPEFREVTLAASFPEGVGLSGRAWKTKDLVFVEALRRSPTA